MPYMNIHLKTHFNIILLHEIQVYVKYLVRNTGNYMIISVRTGIWFISYLSYWKKHLVILSVEIVWQNHSTLIVFKSKLNLRAQNDTLTRIKYKTNFLLIYSYIFWFIYFFCTTLHSRPRKAATKEWRFFSQGIYWSNTERTEFALRKYYQRLQIVTTNTLHFVHR